MTGAVAAIADPPQIEDPTPISVATFEGIFIALHSTKAMTSEVVMVAMMIGSDCWPFARISARFMPKPSRMTAYWRIFFDVYFTPGSSAVRKLPSFTNSAMTMPMSMAKTGPPTTGANVPRRAAGMAMAKQNTRPAKFFLTISMGRSLPRAVLNATRKRSRVIVAFPDNHEKQYIIIVQ